MAYFPDLTPYEYLRRQAPMLNVGWLSGGKAFDRGPVSDQFASALYRLAQTPVNLCRGFHVCELCTSPGVDYYPVWSMGRRGNGEVHVRGSSGVTYAAPTLIWHYVVEHQYLPPQEFIDAVTAWTGRVVAGAGLESLFQPWRTLARLGKMLGQRR